MHTSPVPLIAQSLIEIGVVAFAGWEIWKLRTPKPKKPPPPPSPDTASADPAGHAVGEHGLDDGGS